MPKLNQIPKGLVIAIIAASFLGFADSTYLTVLHYAHILPPCTILQGCEKVTSSSYSVVLGIPVSLAGVIYYLSIFLLSLAQLQGKKTRLIRIIVPLSIVAFAASFLLVYLQLFVIKSICPYCMFSALTSTTIFVCIIAAYFKKPLTFPNSANDTV